MSSFRRTVRTTAQRRARLWLTGLVTGAMALVLVGVQVPASNADSQPQDPSDPHTPPTVTNDALPTVQIDGVVWSQAMVGNTVYAGGSFTKARPAGSAVGTNELDRTNLLAYDVVSGDLVASFHHDLNGQVLTVAVSPDKTRVYVGGEFTSVDGVTRRRIAAFDSATGDLVDGFAPQVNGIVAAIVATSSTVYVGGSFGGVGNQDRSSLAAVRASDGALLPWAPQATRTLGNLTSPGEVRALALKPDGTRVVVGGSFTALNGSSDPGYGLGMVDASGTGTAVLPFAVNHAVTGVAGTPDFPGVRNATADGAVTTLTTDDNNVYGAGYTFGRSGGTLEGLFSASWNGGTVTWIDDCHGDMYSLHKQGDAIYAASHTHYCENIAGFRQGDGEVGDYPYHRGIAFGSRRTGVATWEPDQGRYYSFEGQPTSSLLNWFPSINAGTFTGQTQGPWSVTGNANYVSMGGEFTRVNGTDQQGLVRFAVPSIAPNAEGPELFGAGYPITVTSSEPGRVRIFWRANSDSDNELLTYKIQRRPVGGNESAIHTRSVRAPMWNLSTMGFTDTGLTPGALFEYRLQVSDPFGVRTANSSWTPVTVSATDTETPYTTAVLDDEPEQFWPLGEEDGTTAEDTVGFEDATVQPGVAGGATGATGGLSSRFNGTAQGYAQTTGIESPTDVFSLEAWFRTTSTTGGKLVGFQDNIANNRRDVDSDRHLYLDASGHVNFGVRPNASRQVLTSPGTFNDGRWHLATATLGPAGMALYVDGAPAGSRSDVTVGQHLLRGFWRIGGSSLTRCATGGTNCVSWPNAEGLTGFFDGRIDDVAVYKHVLTPVRVAAHFAAAGAAASNQPPAAAFDAPVAGMAVHADASRTVDADGTVASYAWKFGDGTTGAGATATHTYAAPGRYNVTLKVTDDKGATDALSMPIRVPVNTPPVARDMVLETQVGVDINPLVLQGSDPDTLPGESVTFRTTAPKLGRLRSNGTRYTPPADPGRDTFSYTVTDADGATATANVTIRVYSAEQGPNKPPVAMSLTGRTTADHALTLTLPAEDVGDDGPHGYAFSGLGGATVTGFGPKVTYKPKAGFVGKSSFTYTVTDELGSSDSAVVTVLVAKNTAKITRMTLSPKRLTHATRARMTVRVAAGGRPASGWVQVRTNGRVIGKARLNASGATVVKLKAMGKGSHRVSVVYLGNATTKSVTAKLLVRVRR